MKSAASLFPLCMVLAMVSGGVAVAQTDQATSARLDALFGEHEPYQKFLTALKAAVSADDKEAVAAMIAYPLETTIAGEQVTLESAGSFVQRYDRLFTPAVVADVERQTYATLFAAAEGVMIDDGEIWFSGVCSDQACSEATIRIIAVNPTAGEPRAPSDQPSGADR